MALAYSRVRTVVAPASSKILIADETICSFSANARLAFVCFVHEQPPIFLRLRFNARSSRESVGTDTEIPFSRSSRSCKSASVISGSASDGFQQPFTMFVRESFLLSAAMPDWFQITG